MKKVLCAAIALLLAGALYSKAYADEAIKEGKWSVTVAVTTTGLPQAVSPQTYTKESCVTNQNLVPDLKMPPGCSSPQVEKKDNTVSFNMSCDTQGMKMISSGHVTYSGEDMDGVSTSQMTVGGMEMNSTAQISGKYLGPCD